MTTRNTEEIYSYAKQAYDLIPEDHPHRDEIKQLLIDQVNDELHDYGSTTVPHRRTDTTGEGSD